MKRSLVLLALVLAACGGGAESGSQPPANEKITNTPTDSAALETTRAGAVQAAQQRADQAEADMAERARQAQEQVQAAEGGTAQP